MTQPTDAHAGSGYHDSSLVPNSVLARRDLTAEAKIVYAYLGTLAWRNEGSARELISQGVGLSPQAVSKALHLLSSVPANGRDGPPLVEAIRRGQGKTNRYVIHDAS